MAKFDSKEELVVKIGEIYTKMSNGSVEIEELDALVALSEELYQRNVIIRYKAFENKVFGEKVEASNSIETEVDFVADEPIFSSPIEVVEERPSIPFSLFEEPIQEEPIVIVAPKVEEPTLPLFDLETEIEPEKEIETPSFFQSTIEEPVIETIEAPVVESIQPEIESIQEEIIETELPIESTIEVDEVYNQEDTQTIEEPIIHSEEIVTEYDDNSVEIERTTILEDPQTHEIVEETHSYEATSADEIAISSFVHKFKEIDRILAGQFGITKLDTLVGSFGLNERLQYINELFDGSSDDFSNAVKVLDNQPTTQEAFLKFAEIGTLNNWDINSETVEEFMQKIRRRYYA